MRRTHHDLRFFIYDDIELLAGKYPIYQLFNAEVFVMQEDRIVFIGSRKTCEYWIKLNENKFCSQIPNINN